MSNCAFVVAIRSEIRNTGQATASLQLWKLAGPSILQPVSPTTVILSKSSTGGLSACSSIDTDAAPEGNRVSHERTGQSGSVGSARLVIGCALLLITMSGQVF